MPVHQVEDGDQLPVEDLAAAGGQRDDDLLLDGHDPPRGRLLQVRFEQGHALVDVALLRALRVNDQLLLLPLPPGPQEGVADGKGRDRTALLDRAVKVGQGLVDGVAEGQGAGRGPFRQPEHVAEEVLKRTSHVGV